MHSPYKQAVGRRTAQGIALLTGLATNLPFTFPPTCVLLLGSGVLLPWWCRWWWWWWWWWRRWWRGVAAVALILVLINVLVLHDVSCVLVVLVHAFAVVVVVLKVPVRCSGPADGLSSGGDAGIRGAGRTTAGRQRVGHVPGSARGHCELRGLRRARLEWCHRCRWKQQQLHVVPRRSWSRSDERAWVRWERAPCFSNQFLRVRLVVRGCDFNGGWVSRGLCERVRGATS